MLKDWDYLLSRNGRGPTGRVTAYLPRWVDQKTVMQGLLDQEIATRRGFMCSHRELPYSDKQQRHDLRQSELAQDHSILLPIYAQMTEDEVVHVADAARRELQQRSRRSGTL